MKRPNALILEIAGMAAMEVMQLQQLWYTNYCPVDMTTYKLVDG